MKTNLLPSRDRSSRDGVRGSAAWHRGSARCRLSTVSAMVLLAGATAGVSGRVQAADAEPAGSALSSDQSAKPKGPVGGGIGLSPNTPQLGGGTNLTEKEAESLTPTVSAGTADEWKFSFHGYLRGPMRVSFGPPTPSTLIMQQTPSPVTSGTQLHSTPRVPGSSYIDWQYTNTIPGPWSQLNFSYGNSRAMMTVIVDGYSQTSGGYRDLQAQQGIDQAFITLNFPEALGRFGGLVWNVGTFQNRYGTAGKYDGGMYETYVFGRTHVSGITGTANIDTGSEWGLSTEAGIGSKIEIIPFSNNQLYQLAKSAPTAGGWIDPVSRTDRELEYLPTSGPTPQGSTFLAHGHVGLASKMWSFGAHVLYTWTPDDNWDPRNSNIRNVTDKTPRAMGPTQGSLLIAGGEVRLNGGYWGDGYLGVSHMDAKNINALSDSVEVLNSNSGWSMKQSYFGRNYNFHTGEYLGPQNESGKIDTVSAQYTFSFGGWARRPAAFWGDGPDLAVTLFGMFTKVDSPPLNSHTMSTKKLKFGADLIYTPLDWFGVGGRFDVVEPDLDAVEFGSQANFKIFSPRLVFKTAFVTHEAITVMYQHYFLGSAAYPVFPYEWVAKADPDLLAISGTMWW